jgi:hypothetical protein
MRGIPMVADQRRLGLGGRDRGGRLRIAAAPSSSAAPPSAGTVQTVMRLPNDGELTLTPA